jgi:Tfp pilus assembly pilus retraction ATPase PilT
MVDANSQNSATQRLDYWLSALVARGGSDLLLVAGVPASIRFEGMVQPLDDEKLSGSEIEATVLPALIPRALQQYQEGQISDSSYRIDGLGRFRINLHREKGMARQLCVPCLHGFRSWTNCICRQRWKRSPGYRAGSF